MSKLTRSMNVETADWKVWLYAWNSASGQGREYTAYGVGPFTEDLRSLKPFLGVPSSSHVISCGAQFYGRS